MEKRKLPKLSSKLMECLCHNIQESIESVHQWVEMEAFGLAATHNNRLEAFVNLLEEYDCGSHGGYGKNQPSNQTLEQRAKWLLEKYL